MSQAGLFAGVKVTGVQEHPSLVNLGALLCYLPLLASARAPTAHPSAQGTCSLLLSGTVFLLGLVFFLDQSWAGFVWEGGICFLCKHEVCTISVWIAGMSSFIVPGSISCFHIRFSVCFVSCRTKLLTKSRSPSAHHGVFWGV